MRGQTRHWVMAGGLTVAVPVSASAQEVKTPVSISGSTRLRYEAIDGQARAGANRSDDLFNVRTVLTAEWRAQPVRLVAELWDSRAYLADRGTPLSTGEVNTVELVQAYVEVPVGPAVKLTAGRYVLNLGSRRFVAADDYRNTTNGYTGARVDAGVAGWRGTAIYVLPQQRRPDDAGGLRDNESVIDREGFDLMLWGGVAARAKAVGAGTVELSFFHLGEHDRPRRPTRDRSLDTAAVRIVREPAAGQADYDVEAAAQWGRVSTGPAANAARLAVGAWYVHGELGRSLAGRWKPRVAVEYDHASGDRPGGRYARFDTLFGMRRAEIAPAGLYNAVGRANVLSPGARVEVEPRRGTDAFVGYRALWLASRFDSFSTTGVRDATGRSGRFAGHQIDARVRHQLARAVRLELDGVLLARGRFLRNAPNAPAGRWTRYISVNATFAFR